MTTPLTISAQAMRHIDAVVRVAGAVECMGLLGSEPGSETVTSIEVLPAEATPTRAEASPLALKRAADAMAAKAIVPRGIWHSHGRFDVFHSGTDVATIDRLLPTMAMHGFRRDTPIATPALEGSDTAALPLSDGRLMIFTLVTDPIPGTDLSAPASWARVTVDYPRAAAAPVAEMSATDVRLVSSGVALTLGVPAGARVERRIVDRATVRHARLFSLVVNTKRHRYAQSLVVADLAGEMVTSLVDCDVEVVGDDRSDASDLQTLAAKPQLLDWLDGLKGQNLHHMSQVFRLALQDVRPADAGQEDAVTSEAEPHARRSEAEPR
jgi:hypothetical protein